MNAVTQRCSRPSSPAIWRRWHEKPTLFLSVSLNAAFSEGREEAQDYVDEFKMRTHFTPGRELLVAGAVRNTKYDFFASQVIRHVVMRGRKYDPEAAEHDFTDWDELNQVLAQFLQD